mmetsp:Transcript_31244/g.52875  ORF Transcript_31244/g.52875 Transcript_31244/m.52875 type:complete len:95 (+) Transcript_31244:75-359(+)
MAKGSIALKNLLRRIKNPLSFPYLNEKKAKDGFWHSRQRNGDFRLLTSTKRSTESSQSQERASSLEKKIKFQDGKIAYKNLTTSQLIVKFNITN